MREALIFVAGIGIGGLLGTMISDRKYAARLDEDVANRIEEIHDAEMKEKEKKNETTTHEKKAYSDLVGSNYIREEKKGGEEVRKNYSNVEVDDEDDASTPEYEHPEDDDEVATSPYEITEDEFDEENGYDKTSLYYYKANMTLVNDSDMVEDMEDTEITLGHDWVRLANRNGYGVFYIRNERLKTDYEIVVNEGAYPVEV